VDDIFEAVHGGDLALTALVGAALDDNLVVLADGDGADLIRVLVEGWGADWSWKAVRCTSRGAPWTAART
jgi:hypothetical protein